MKLRTSSLAFVLALCAGCAPEIVIVTGSDGSATAASGASSSGAGGASASCIERLTTPDGLPDVDAEFTLVGDEGVSLGPVDVAPSGEIAFSGSTFGQGLGTLELNGAPIATCTKSCEFIGVLAADGSLEWVRTFSGSRLSAYIVHFDKDAGLVVVGSDAYLSAPFPPTPVMYPDQDPFWARFDSQGELTAFVPMGSTGGLALVVGASPTSDGGMMVGGTFLNGGDNGFPAGSFVGCGASVPLDHPLGFLAHLGPDGVCDRFDPVGSSPLMLSAFGGESTSSGDRVTIGGTYETSLDLGPQHLDAPKGGEQGFVGSGVVLSTGEAWGQLLGAASGPVGDLSVNLDVSRDGTTALLRTSGVQPDEDLALVDVLGAFRVSISSPADIYSWGVGAGRSPSGMIEDRPIFASGGNVYEPSAITMFGGEGSVDGQGWFALFDGAGHLCAARPTETSAGWPIVGGSSVTFVGAPMQDVAAIRRIQLAELAQ